MKQEYYTEFMKEVHLTVMICELIENISYVPETQLLTLQKKISDEILKRRLYYIKSHINDNQTYMSTYEKNILEKGTGDI